MRTKIDKTYLKLVNRQNPLESHKPDFYEYDDVIVRTPNYEVFEDDVVVERGERSSLVKTFIEKRTNQAFEDLKKDLESRGVNARINEAGRLPNKQKMYRENAEKNHGIEYAENYVARPYETEHGLGTAIDIGVFSRPLSNIKINKVREVAQRLVKPRMYSILHNVAVKHGFITRYPVKYTLTDNRRKKIKEASNNINGTISSSREEFQKLQVQYNYEPWHQTYVGEFNAEFITANKLTLEEYVKLVDAYEDYANEFNDDENCPSLQVFYNLYTLGKEWDERNM